MIILFQSEIIHAREMRSKPTQSGSDVDGNTQEALFDDDVNVLQIVSISFKLLYSVK